MDIAQANAMALRSNPYPGRGIVIGENTSGQLIQVYWVMGRSENSRNRILVQEDGTIKTAPHDISKVKDPSLIIYTAMRSVGPRHIVSNGDQTDTIAAHLLNGNNSLEVALAAREREPDAPNYTPRISGLLDAALGVFALSKISKDPADPAKSVHAIYRYLHIRPGYGFCVHTYNGEGDPLPSFDRDPYPVALEGSLDDIATTYWGLLNQDNRVALVVKAIAKDTGDVGFRIINRLQ